MPGLHHQPIDHQLDVVLELLVEREPLLERVDHAVDAHPGEAALLGVAEQLAVLALAVLHQRAPAPGCASPSGSSRIVVDDLLGGLLAHLRPQEGQCCTPMEA